MIIIIVIDHGRFISALPFVRLLLSVVKIALVYYLLLILFFIDIVCAILPTTLNLVTFPPCSGSAFVVDNASRVRGGYHYNSYACKR